MEMEQVLRKIGLSDKEVQIYLTALQLGRAPASTIAAGAGLNRSTGYLLMKELVKRGFLTRTTRGAVQHFAAVEPARIVPVLEAQVDAWGRRVAEYEAVVPELEALRPAGLSAPKLRYYHGHENVARLYKEIQREPVWCGFFDPLYIQEQFPPELHFEVIAGAMQKRATNVRDLMVDSPYVREMAEKYTTPGYEYRVLPVGTVVRSDTIILPDRYYQVSFAADDCHMIEIVEPNLTAAQQLMFDGLWAQAEPLHKREVGAGEGGLNNELSRAKSL